MLVTRNKDVCVTKLENLTYLVSYIIHIYYACVFVSQSNNIWTRVERRYSGGLTETWANRRCLGAAGAQEPRIAVSKHSYNILSAGTSEAIAEAEEDRTIATTWDGRVHKRQQSQ